MSPAPNTAQNIEQPSLVLALRDAHQVICGQLAELLDGLADFAERTADDVEPGRTHWQHAVPITFGFKVAAWIDQMIRHLDRLQQVAPRLFTSMTGGAAGTFASLGPQAPQVQAGVARLLGLEPMAVPSRAIVDHFAEFVCVLGLISATAASMAEEVARLMSAEYGEVSEPIPPGDVGSSTTPQKRNSKLSGGVVIFAAQARAAVPMAIDAIIQSHEVDGTRSVLMEHALEQACVGTAEALSMLIRIVAGLEVYGDRMRANLDLTAGLINAEAVMLALARSVGRQEAHHIVHDAATKVLTGVAERFDYALLADPQAAAALDHHELALLLDPTNCTGLSSQIAYETSARARQTVKEWRARGGPQRSEDTRSVRPARSAGS